LFVDLTSTWRTFSNKFKGGFHQIGWSGFIAMLQFIDQADTIFVHVTGVSKNRNGTIYFNFKNSMVYGITYSHSFSPKENLGNFSKAIVSFG
jgi:hypothetical protein